VHFPPDTTCNNPRPQWDPNPHIDHRRLGANTEQKVRRLQSKYTSLHATLGFRNLEFSPDSSFIICLGVQSKEVPAYLRYDNLVTNFMWPEQRAKDEAAKLWSYRLKLDEAAPMGSEPMPLSDAVYRSLKESETTPAVQAEFIYNFYSALSRHSHMSAYLSIFKACLHDEIEVKAVDPEILNTATNLTLILLGGVDFSRDRYGIRRCDQIIR